MTAASKVTLTRIFLIPVYMVLMYVSGGVAGGSSGGIHPGQCDGLCGRLHCPPLQSGQ